MRPPRPGAARGRALCRFQPDVVRSKMIIAAIVSRDQSFTESVEAAFQQLSERLISPERPRNDEPRATSVEETVLSRASRFIQRVMQDGTVALRTISAPSTSALTEKFAAVEEASHVILTIVHESAIRQNVDNPGKQIDDDLEHLRGAGLDSLSFGPNAGSVRVYYDSDEPSAPHTLRAYDRFQTPSDSSVLRAQVIAAFTEQFQFQSGNDHGRADRPGTALAFAIQLVMDDIAPCGWDLRYYTGSVVSSLINALESTIEHRGQVAFRGPNEHSLAAGAIARWILDEVPSVIVVTSAMLDEFRGTLANLRESGFKGIIVCAEGRESAWFGFQATINVAEDTRDVLRARRLPFLYLQEPSEIAKELSNVAEYLRSDAGPFVILATQDVLEASTPIAAFTEDDKHALSESEPINMNALTEVARILSDPDRNVLVQAGRLSWNERKLLHDLAEKSGAALVDSLTHPGSVAEYVNGVRVPHYVGTLGLYGFNTAVHRFTHAGGKPRPKTELTYVFLNSNLGEASTPFSEGVLRRRLHIVQVTDKKTHISPSADISIVASADAFLTALIPLLKINTLTQERRLTHIAACTSRSPAISEMIASSPMTANYFFARLRETITTLIEDEQYTYTGVYDVGRCGVSAIRNVPRTNGGFSGWFGRAIMGDAYQAIPSIAYSRKGNVIGFIGDGAASIGPDIIPTVAEHADRQGKAPTANIVVFILENGGHSIINSYQEGRLGTYGGRQMRLFNLPPTIGTTQVSELAVRKTFLDSYDEQAIRAALKDSHFFDVIHVRLAHTNGGDGISLIDETSWQGEEISQLGVSMARMRRT